MKKNTVLVSAVVGLLIVVAVVGFAVSKSNNSTTNSSSSSTSSVDTSKAVATNVVMIHDYMFSPMAIKVKVGTKVTWTNMDSVHHTIDSADKAKADIDSPLLAQNQSFSYTFKKAGTFAYICDVHPYMKAVVVVTN